MAEKSFWGNKKDKEWFANFFHYYGMYIAVLLFFVVLALWGIDSCNKKIDYDCEIYYMADKHFESKVYDNVENVFKDIVDDADGRKGVHVSFSDFTVVPENAATSDIDLYMTAKIHAEIAEGHGYLYVMNDQWKEYCENSELMEDISVYTGEEGPVYSYEITDNEFMNKLGVVGVGKLYVGVRMLNNNRKDNQVEITRHNNAINVLKYIIENN